MTDAGCPFEGSLTKLEKRGQLLYLRLDFYVFMFAFLAYSPLRCLDSRVHLLVPKGPDMLKTVGIVNLLSVAYLLRIVIHY